MDNIEKIINTQPTGGFPLFHICEKKTKSDNINDLKTRGFAKDKNIVNIQEILNERRNKKDQFIVL